MDFIGWFGLLFVKYNNDHISQYKIRKIF